MLPPQDPQLLALRPVCLWQCGHSIAGARPAGELNNDCARRWGLQRHERTASEGGCFGGTLELRHSQCGKLVFALRTPSVSVIAMLQQVLDLRG